MHCTYLFWIGSVPLHLSNVSMISSPNCTQAVYLGAVRCTALTYFLPVQFRTAPITLPPKKRYGFFLLKISTSK